MLSEETMVIATCKCGYEYYTFEITDFWDTTKENKKVKHEQCWYCQNLLASPKEFIKHEEETVSTGSGPHSS